MKKPFFKKILTSSIISLFFVQMLYLAVEPTIVSATIDAVDTGGVLVTLNVTAGITISNGSNITMTPHIDLTHDRAVGTASWTVTTNNYAGYDLAVVASTSPALKQGAVDEFIDYTEVSAGVPELWLDPAVGAKEFGFSAFGTDVLAKYYVTTPADCGNTSTGITNALGKYEGFSYNTPITIASKSAITPSTGELTTLCVAAHENQVFAKSGTYTATITATATTK